MEAKLLEKMWVINVNVHGLIAAIGVFVQFLC